MSTAIGITMTTLTAEPVAAPIVKSSTKRPKSQVMIVSPQGKGSPRKETGLSGMGDLSLE
jgi:hypothetical protein